MLPMGFAVRSEFDAWLASPAFVAMSRTVRSGALSIPKATAMGALYKELNTNIQVEINAAKMALATEGKAHNFGKVVGMGRRLIGNGVEQPDA